MRYAMHSTGHERVDWSNDLRAIEELLKTLPDTEHHHVTGNERGSTLFAASDTELHVLDYAGRTEDSPPSWTVATHDLAEAVISIESDQVDHRDYGLIVNTRWTFAFPTGDAVIAGADRIQLHDERFDADERFARLLAGLTGKRRPLPS